MRMCRSRSPTAGTCFRPAVWCWRGRRASCGRTRTCGRPTLGVRAGAATLPGSCRHRFPIFERMTYLNSCSQGALSDAVRAAYDDYLTGWDERGAPWDYWVEPEDVAVTTSLSAGVSALASALEWRERPRVVVSDFEFPTIGQIWHAQELRGAEVVHVPAEGARIPLERFDAAIDEQTAVVSVTAVCYRNG